MKLSLSDAYKIVNAAINYSINYQSEDKREYHFISSDKWIKISIDKYFYNITAISIDGQPISIRLLEGAKVAFDLGYKL